MLNFLELSLELLDLILEIVQLLFILENSLICLRQPPLQIQVISFCLFEHNRCSLLPLIDLKKFLFLLLKNGLQGMLTDCMAVISVHA